MDPCVDGEDQTPSLLERNQSQWENVHGQPNCKRIPQQLWGPALCPMEGGDLLAASCPTGGLGVVGCPTLAQWTLPWGFQAQHWCLWPQQLTGNGAGEDPGLSLGASGLCWRVRGPNRCSPWLSMRTSKMHSSLDDPQQGWHSWGLPLETHQSKMFSPRMPWNPWAGRTYQVN